MTVTVDSSSTNCTSYTSLVASSKITTKSWYWSKPGIHRCRLGSMVYRCLMGACRTPWRAAMWVVVLVVGGSALFATPALGDTYEVVVPIDSASASCPGTVRCPSPAVRHRRRVPPGLLPATSNRAFIPANDGGHGVSCRQGRRPSSLPASANTWP